MCLTRTQFTRLRRWAPTNIDSYTVLKPNVNEKICDSHKTTQQCTQITKVATIYVTLCFTSGGLFFTSN